RDQADADPGPAVRLTSGPRAGGTGSLPPARVKKCAVGSKCTLGKKCALGNKCTVGKKCAVGDEGVARAGGGGEGAVRRRVSPGGELLDDAGGLGAVALEHRGGRLGGE